MRLGQEQPQSERDYVGAGSLRASATCVAPIWFSFASPPFFPKPKQRAGLPPTPTMTAVLRAS
jgi:hypothetical protein